jgi:hypothetical protein
LSREEPRGCGGLPKCEFSFPNLCDRQGRSVGEQKANINRFWNRSASRPGRERESAPAAVLATPVAAREHKANNLNSAALAGAAGTD